MRVAAGWRRVRLRLQTGNSYLCRTKWPRRFCCQHCSLDSLQNGFSFPALEVPMLFVGTPPRTSASFTAAARLSPSARLYSVEPRSSQWPSTLKRTLGCCFRKPALAAICCCASGRRSKLSYSKNTSLTFVANNCSSLALAATGGGAAATVTRAVASWVRPGPFATTRYVVEASGLTVREPLASTL